MKKEEVDKTALAAIGLALHEMAEEVHDVESNVLTIQYNNFGYSPWSSKVLLMRQPIFVKKR
ncbi:hypothetical protein [Microbacter margulisiae]|uniref:Uncharacterized protein n=1 Tax=Microbacter margulisiae TaxID=1350067 RepID=A0A7W5H2C9_9PORP|nr:hypothetical protein [Microbacter margulisiae]MBB3187292.1 hypothetical protein [Microbacter margulisiae]